MLQLWNLCQNRYDSSQQSFLERSLNVFENYEKQKLDVNGSITVRLPMYYRFVKDFRYANFVIKYQKVGFRESLILPVLLVFGELHYH